MREIEVEVGGIVARAVLFEDRAPRTCAKVLGLLPLEDRTIHVRWSGAAWRTEKNYPLQLDAIENPVTILGGGDIIYYDDGPRNLFKIGVAYGPAAWRDFEGDIHVAHIGRIGANLEAFTRTCDRILFEGPKIVRIRCAG